MKVASGGLRSLRIIKQIVEQAGIVRFLKAYDYYEQRMEIAAEDGTERSVASMRELVVGTGTQDYRKQTLSVWNRNEVNGKGSLR